VSRLLVATHNPGKLAEFRRLLATLDADVLGTDDLGLHLEVEEPHDTYAANATDKAVAHARASGLLTVADDSGIEVAALRGGPGVSSARFENDDGLAGADLLLERLGSASDRRARMVCWLAIAVPAAGSQGPEVDLFEGIMDGVITHARRGGGGFGYDPVFELPDGRTTAELADGEKDRVSHRGRAVAAALPRLREHLAAQARMSRTAEDA
jgi:XTP/dITP diphosphohydrolase